MTPGLGSILFRAAWLLGALVVAVGGAGIVDAISHTPGTAAREELTWAADQAIRPGLADALDDLETLNAEVDGLGRAGRGALAALARGDSEAVAAAVADGNERVRLIDGQAADLRAKLANLPGIGPGAEGRLGWGVRQEYAAIGRTIELTKDLRANWAVLTTGSAAADRLTALLARHDAYVLEGVRFGNKRFYATAVTSIKRASVRLDAAQQLRDVLANTANVATLDEWIARNRAIDAALIKLYGALSRSKGRLTTAVKNADAAVVRAKAQLPPDTAGLVVIMGDLSRAGLNQAVIAIEESNRGLAEAVKAIRAAETAESTGGTG